MDVSHMLLYQLVNCCSLISNVADSSAVVLQGPPTMELFGSRVQEIAQSFLPPGVRFTILLGKPILVIFTGFCLKQHFPQSKTFWACSAKISWLDSISFVSAANIMNAKHQSSESIRSVASRVLVSPVRSVASYSSRCWAVSCKAQSQKWCVTNANCANLQELMLLHDSIIAASRQ